MSHWRKRLFLWLPSREMFNTRPAATLLLGAAMLLAHQSATAGERKPSPLPDQFLMGRFTFFDFGPPTEYYEVYAIHAKEGGTLIERLQVTPEGVACLQPPKVDYASATINESLADLIGGTNPCSIPEKELRRERKRCKHCLSFSGARVAMQIQCGDRSRRIRMDILDRDLFDPHPNPPPRTSWTMALMARLDQALGANVMDRPMFDVSDNSKSAAAKPETNPLLGDLQRGTFDDFFGITKPDPPLSEMYRQAQIPPPQPNVDLVESSPFRPVSNTPLKYPPIARLARIEGEVRFSVVVQPDGRPSEPKFLNGHPLLSGYLKAVVPDWRFPAEAAGQEVRIAVEFKLNCVIKAR